MKNKVKCKCGCGKWVNSFDAQGRAREYIRGHNPSKRKLKLSPIYKSAHHASKKEQGFEPAWKADTEYISFDLGLIKGKESEEDWRIKKVFHFFTFLSHTEGQWKGQLFRLLDWQRDLIERLFGTLKEDGYRQYKECYVEIPKKNGKSEFAAAIALYLLCADDEHTPEIVIAACDVGQANLIFKKACIMIRNNSSLRESLKIVEGQKQIRYPYEDGTLKVISAKTETKHGMNLSGLVIDELMAQPNRSLFDVLTQGSMAARNQGLALYLTTAGDSRESVGWEVHERSVSLLEGKSNETGLLPILYSLPEEQDWKDEENWKLVNPALKEVDAEGKTILDSPGIIKLEDLRQNFSEKASILPAEEFAFRRKRLNQWTTDTAQTWIPEDIWRACGADIHEEDMRGLPCFVGLDMSKNEDLTAISFIFKGTEDDYFVFPYFLLPQAGIEDKERRDGVPYKQWAEQGYLSLTPGPIVDPQVVSYIILQKSRDFDIQTIAYDPAMPEINQKRILEPLEDKSLVVVSFSQVRSVAGPAYKSIQNLVLNQKLMHPNHPILNWNMRNVLAVEDFQDNLQIKKVNQISRIDGVTSMMMALSYAIKGGEEPSYMSRHGHLLVIGEGMNWVEGCAVCDREKVEYEKNRSKEFQKEMDDKNRRLGFRFADEDPYRNRIK